MKNKNYTTLIILFFLLMASQSYCQVSITALPQTYTQNFDAGLGTSSIVGTWVDNTTILGWYEDATPNLPINTGTTSTNNCFNFGIAATNPITDRALGAISTGVITHRFGVRIANNSGTAINSFDISFAGEEWRSNLSGTLAFEYQQASTVTSITAGTWTPVTAFDFISLVNGGGALDGNAAANRIIISGTLTVTVPAGQEIMLRWRRSGANSPALAIDDVSITANVGCAVPTNTYYYRSIASGNWSSLTTWEASPNGSTGWVAACTAPTSAAAGVTIQSGHTVTIDINSSSPDLTINAGGTLQANSTSFVSFTEMGNVANNGTLQMYNAPKAVDFIFNKNGNQTVTGTGGITNFYSIAVNLGNTTANVLDISSTNFSSSTDLLVNSSGVYTILNGTLKFSGNYTFTNRLFSATAPTIPATASIWLNNPNVTITANNYNVIVGGIIKVTSGTFNVGTALDNSIILKTNAFLVVQGGTVNVAGRIQAVNLAGTLQNFTTYNQSGGTVNLLTIGSTSTTISGLDFETATDNFMMSGGTIIVRNEASAVEIYNYATGTVSGGTIQFGDAASTNVTTAGYLINSTCPLPSIVINNSSGLNPVVKLYNNLTVIGSITINPSTIFSNSYDDGTHFSSIYDLFDVMLTGNWNNNGVFTNYGSNKVTFNGSAAQNITGTTSTSFNRLTIVNSSGGVTLQVPCSVDSVLQLINGYVYTSATNLLTMNTYSSAVGTNNNSFVYGPVAKVGSTAFIFPVGKDLEYRPIADSALSASETFTAEYFHTPPDPTYSISLHDPTIDHLGNCEYWILNRAGSANAYVKLSWNTYSCGVTSLPALTVARWDGAMWRDHGNGGTTGTTTTGTIITSGLVTSFSPFTLGATIAGTNPLPIELVSFTGICDNNNIKLQWATATETDNNYFEIERTTDGDLWKSIATIKGSGNSTININYSAIDFFPRNGINYYRLKQTDYNGEFKYSSIIAVSSCNQNTTYSIRSNPASTEFTIDVTTDVDKDLILEVYDVIGNLIIKQKQCIVIGTNVIKTNMEQYENGMYFVKLSDANSNTLYTQKLIKQ